MYTKNILMTGSTGFLGSFILKNILDETCHNVFLLIRAKNQDEALIRLKKLIFRIYKEDRFTRYNKRLEVFCGDQTQSCLGLSRKKYFSLFKKINEIYHCAALTEFNEPWEKVYKVNVCGTENIFKFAYSCNKFTKLNYISTAFVVGNSRIHFTEVDLSTNQNFNNTYEKSKYEAELLAKDFIKKGLKIAIYRPSIVVGDYLSGETTNFRMFYKPFRSLSLGLFAELPLNKDGYLNLIPVDYAARAIFTLAENEDSAEVYHIVNPRHFSLPYLMDFAADFFGYKNPKFISLGEFDSNHLTAIQKKILKIYLPYFTYGALFFSEKTQKILARHHFFYPDTSKGFLERIFNFCIKSGYINSKKLNKVF